MSLDLSSTILDLIKSVNDVTETFVSRNGSSMYGSLSPYNNKGASLGTSSKQWNTIYGGTIYENGTSLSNKYGVTVTQKLTSGTEIGSIKVGSTTTKLYAPTGSGSVSGNYLPLSGGTMTGDITLNGTRKIKTEIGTSYIEFEGGDSALYLGAYDHITLDSTNIYIYGDQGDSYLTLDSHGVTIKADYTQNGNITLSAKQGVISATAPTNVSGKEQVTAWFNTANGGRVGFGKEATNSGTGIFFDQVSGTRRLNFRASATAGEMVWEQPESGSCLYYDVGGVQFRGCSSIMFNQFKSAGYLYTDSSGSLKKGTMPTSLKNPKALTFGSKTYDGSTAQTITASDIGANVTVTQKLTSGTEIGSIKVGSTTTKLYAPTSTGSGSYQPKKRKVTLAELRTAMQTMTTGTRIQVVPYGIDDDFLYSVGACIAYSTTYGSAYNSQTKSNYDGEVDTIYYVNWEITITDIDATAIGSFYSTNGSSILVDEVLTENLTDSDTDFYILD